jgi:hypothetical protein
MRGGEKRMKIVTEDLRDCIGGRGSLRYYVIKEPINETGICYQFETKAEAEAFIAEKESPQKAD